MINHGLFYLDPVFLYQSYVLKSGFLNIMINHYLSNLVEYFLELDLALISGLSRVFCFTN